MQGQICIITGASSGVGKAAALELARTGATVALVCRNSERAETARNEIRMATGNQSIDVLLADLSSQAEIHRLAHEILERYPQIHVLINNAGVLNRERTTTVDGIETVFAVNHLAYYLLTHLLLERLAASGPARIINVASDAHRWGTLDFHDLQNTHGYRVMRVYGQSKLCNILFTRELARRISGTGITANCLHPGGVATGLGWNNGWWAVLIAKGLRPFLRTPEQGADTVVYLATSPEVEAVSGKYFAERRERQPAPAAQDDDAAKRLWQISAELTGVTW
ncbi:MAG: SDR family oxidoreductase [Deltaproteobacteria bacterium]|nr:SDR family oxidoreductase [Deltaproteobacteria bacterium]